MRLQKKYFISYATICMLIISLCCMKSYSQCTGGNISNWTVVGPNNTPVCAGSNCLSGTGLGVGKVNEIFVHPTNAQILFAIGWNGGLFKTINGGTNWTPSNQGLDRIQVSTLTFDIDNPNTMYCSTGDGGTQQRGPDNVFAFESPFETSTSGLFKSTDLGTSWSKINGFPLNTSVNNYENSTRIHKIKIPKTAHINGNKVILVGYSKNTLYPSNGNTSEGGILRSEDNGVTWTETLLPSTTNRAADYTIIRDIEIDHTANSNIVYASGHKLWKSLNLGASWTEETSKLQDLSVVYSGSSVTQGATIRIATSEAKPSRVYIMTVGMTYNGNPESEKRIMYVSDDKLTSNTTPKLTHTGTTDNNLGGEFLEAEQTGTEPNIYTSLIYSKEKQALLGRSTDGGSSFQTLEGYFAGKHHVDIRGLAIEKATRKVIIATDGGINSSTNAATASAGTSTWTNIGNGIANASVMDMDVAQSNNNLIIGCWDNAWMYYDDAASTDKWKAMNIGGDGDKCRINATDPDKAMVAFDGSALGYISFRRTDNKGVSFSFMDGYPNVVANQGPTCLKKHPTLNNTLYSAWVKRNGASSGSIFQILTSTDNGNNWTLLADLSSTSGVNGYEDIRDIVVSPSNINIMYVAFRRTLLRSNNGGSTWAALNYPSINPGQDMVSIAVSNTNADKLWISYNRQLPQNNNSGFKPILYCANTSTLGSCAWVDYSLNLPPEVPVYDLIYDQTATDDALYASTALGVYYRDNKSNGWLCYNNNLPSVKATSLEINYNNNHLYAGLFGRSVWRSPKACNSTLPIDDNTGTKLGTRRAIGTIEAGLNAPLNINSGENAEYVSAREVRLRPGFRAISGSQFKARIANNTQDCGGVYQSGMRQSAQDNYNENVDDIAEDGVGRPQFQ